MTLAATRLTLRLGRVELLAFGGLLVGFIVASFASAAWVDSLRLPVSCLTEVDGQSPACAAAAAAWYAAQQGAGLIGGLLIFLSFAAGLFLGVPIVAREVERGTTRLAWSLAPSRTRWYAARMLPVLAVLAILTVVAGVASDRIIAASNPDLDLSNAFTAFGLRGILLACRAIFIFAVAVVVGAIVARTLPAIILAAVIAAIGLTGGVQVHQEILQREAIPIASDQGGPGDLYIDQKFVLPDGRLVGWEYFSNSDPYDENGNPRYPQVSLIVPGERYRFVEAREALVLLGGSLVALTLAAFVVGRRRPG